MALKKYKPTSPGRRFMATSGFEEVTKAEPEKSLLEPSEVEVGALVWARSVLATEGALDRVKELAS